MHALVKYELGSAPQVFLLSICSVSTVFERAFCEYVSTNYGGLCTQGKRMTHNGQGPLEFSEDTSHALIALTNIVISYEVCGSTQEQEVDHTSISSSSLIPV